MTEYQLDLDLGRRERDEGFKKVIAHHPDYHVRVMAWIRSRPKGWTGTCEDIRIAVTPLIGEPKHSSQWGAAINDAIEKGWLVPTGERPKSKMVQNHARKSGRYRRTSVR